MKLNFSDGVSFETGGKLRIEHRFDGLYVVGGGMLCAVDSYQEGLDLIDSLTEKSK